LRAEKARNSSQTEIRTGAAQKYSGLPAGAKERQKSMVE
jgi:hypothetical protein